MRLRTPFSAGSESRGDNFRDSRGDNRQERKSRSNNLFGRQYAAGAQLGPAGFTASGTFVARSLPAIKRQFPVPQTTFLAAGAPLRASIGARLHF
jgi:hypothetical protein